LRSAAGALCCSCLRGLAETVNLLCVKDTAIYSFSQVIQGVETGYINNSAVRRWAFFAGCNAAATPESSNVRRVLLAFDLSAIPANAGIQVVTLTMGMDTTSDTQARPLSLHRLRRTGARAVGSGRRRRPRRRRRIRKPRRAG